MANTKEYTVKWEIELDATSKEEAAKKALVILRDKKSTATVFGVKEFDNTDDESEDFDVEAEAQAMANAENNRAIELLKSVLLQNDEKDELQQVIETFLTETNNL